MMLLATHKVPACAGWRAQDAAMLTALANSKRGWSKFHTIVLWLGNIKVHCDLLPHAMSWRETEMGAAKVVVVPALWVCPLCCDHPPTTDGGCFDLDVCDSCLDSSVQSPAYLLSDGDDQTDNETGKEDEDGNGCDEKHELGVHTLLRPPDVHVLHPKRVPGVVYLKYL